MQLVAYGAQDIYLTSNPQITFFKVVYRRHTNFSREVIEQTHDGSVGQGKTINVTISRNGDLVHKVYLETDLATHSSDKIYNNPGHAMIDFVELEIGGQTIDKIYGHWMEVWARLSQPNDTGCVGYFDANGNDVYAQISNTTGTTVSYNAQAQNAVLSEIANASGITLQLPSTRYQKLAGGGGITTKHADEEIIIGGSVSVTVPQLQVPLPFWFCKNPGLALPLIALQYHEVKLKIKFSTLGYYLDTDDDVNVWAEYIYLDTPERRRFAQGTHEYLIEQLQRFDAVSSLPDSSGSYCNATLELNFNHPVKELIFAGDYYQNASGYGILPGIANYNTDVTLKLNGHDRFSANRRWNYFSKTQIFEHHTGPGNLYGGLEGLISKENASTDTNIIDLQKLDQIGVYSFALKPEEHQPSGTCNFSRIDSTRLSFNKLYAGTSADAINLVVYAVNYNVLRIMSGMGGLAYSN